MARIITVKAGSGLGLNGCGRGGIILLTSEEGSADAGVSDERCAGGEGIGAAALLEPLPLGMETSVGATEVPAAGTPGLRVVEVGAAVGCDDAGN